MQLPLAPADRFQSVAHVIKEGLVGRFAVSAGKEQRTEVFAINDPVVGQGRTRQAGKGRVVRLTSPGSAQPALLTNR